MAGTTATFSVAISEMRVLSCRSNRRGSASLQFVEMTGKATLGSGGAGTGYIEVQGFSPGPAV
jgi:hypothetical protein